MKLAVVNGNEVEATKGAKGLCRSCGSELIAKCGEDRINHWAHKGRRNCDTWWENETEWHRSWKNNFPQEWQEIIHPDEESGEKHIADVKTDQGWVIEFQHSHIKPEERQSRDLFYRKLVWVVDGLRRKKDLEKFKSAVRDGISVWKKPEVWKVQSDDCALLREWSISNSPIFFEFGTGQQDFWLFISGRPNGWSYVAPFSRAEFIEIHRGSATNIAREFAEFLADYRRVVEKYEPHFRAPTITIKGDPLQALLNAQQKGKARYNRGRGRF